jgi:hypothetical protein
MHYYAMTMVAIQILQTFSSTNCHGGLQASLPATMVTTALIHQLATITADR